MAADKRFLSMKPLASRTNMPNVVLGLQGGSASGSEPTFDGQPIQPGIHLRWAFALELGFPQQGFRICRRVVQPGEKQIPLPVHLSAATPTSNVAKP
jgi:hypothetical protein